MDQDVPLTFNPRRLAVIDCGTNTFSMLIADVKEGSWETIFTMRHPVYIGQGGFKQGTLVPDRFAKGVDALRVMQEATWNYGAKEVLVVATSAVRDASNGDIFCQKVKEITGWDVHVISGQREAELVHAGVDLTLEAVPGVHLIMDIGGGSVEFIMATSSGLDDSKIIWSKSIDAGVARLEDFGKPEDPIGQDGVGRFGPFLEYTLAPLKEAIALHRPIQLIGSSGSFDTFYDLVTSGKGVISEAHEESKHPKMVEIERLGLNAVHDDLIQRNQESRLAMPGMAPARARMMPLSSMLLQSVLEMLPADLKVFRSSYALREGILREVQAHGQWKGK